MASGKGRKPAKRTNGTKRTAAKPAKTAKLGRPSDYGPWACEAAIELGREGKSRTQIARTLDVARSTLGEWEKAHPEFAAAMIRARELSRAWWEDEGQLGVRMGKDFNAAAFIFQMCNRFGRDEADGETPYRQRQEVTGEGGAPLLQPIINLTVGHERQAHGSKPSGAGPAPPPKAG